jgi:hypothetical protein
VDRNEVISVLRLAASASDPSSTGELTRLVDAVAARGLTPEDAALAIAPRAAVRLVAAGYPDVALEVIRSAPAAPTAFTAVRDGRVFAWLPGFDDPRYGAPDDAYDISDRIVLRSGADEVRGEDGRCVIGGFAHLSLLVAEPDDDVIVILRCADGRRHEITARRTRRSDRDAAEGSDGRRLAWSGFVADIDAAVLLDEPGLWQVEIALAQNGVTRRQRLAPTAACGLAATLPVRLPAGSGRELRVRADGRRRLELVAAPHRSRLRRHFSLRAS